MAQTGEGSQALADPSPFRFISEAEIAEGATVITVKVGDVDSVPPGLQAAIDAVCGKDGQQGKASIKTARSLNDDKHIHDMGICCP